ncbi:MAG: hypothetical protein ABI919_08390 [Ramlibacter sp.]
MAQSSSLYLARWIAGGAACVAVIAVAAWLLVDIGGQARERVQAPPPATQAPLSAQAVPRREAEMITELREALAPPSPTSRKPEWAAPPQRTVATRMRAASAARPPAPAALPEPRREAQARPAASTPASRTAAAEPCPGQSGIGQSICLARQCSDTAWRGHRLCGQVRDAEQKMRERYEQGG